jgi:hypothetical protein
LRCFLHKSMTAERPEIARQTNCPFTPTESSA